jgi:hypothetical protein
VTIYPFFHSLQYLLFVGAYKRGEVRHAASAEAVRQAKRFVLGALWIGILCFWAMPAMLETWVNPGKSFLFPVTAAVVIFINIHHYFIDNVIWRSEHAEIRKYLFE